MKKVTFLLSVAWMGIAICACASSDIISRKIEADCLTEINTTFPIDIYYTQGKTTSIELKGPTCQFERMEANLEKGILNLTVKDKYTDWKLGNVKCYITAPTLTRITVNTVCSFLAEGSVQFKDFTFKGNGVCKIDFADLSCENFTLTNSGVCNSTLNIRKADKVLINSKGTGNANLIINCNKVSFHNSGTNNIKARVDCRTLQANNSGTGSITLSGIADDVKINNSGISRIDVSGLNK